MVGFIESPWGPIVLALAMAAPGTLVFETVPRLALERGWVRLLNERRSPENRRANEPGGASRSTASRSPAADPKASQPASPAPTTPPAPKSVPLNVILGALTVGALAVAIAALVMRPKSQPGATAAKADSVATADTALDIGWRSGRMDGNDCLGTFEVKRGAGTPARFVAFVLDSSGAVMAQDSGGVAAAVRGVLVDFRFRRVTCSKIADWQLQALTPK
jgi:hypothetical protein